MIEVTSATTGLEVYIRIPAIAWIREATNDEKKFNSQSVICLVDSTLIHVKEPLKTVLSFIDS